VAMALFWLGLIIVVALLIRWSTKESSSSSTRQEKSALDILKERFARGEIDKQEFEESKHILTG
jgi:putative membrane protein